MGLVKKEAALSSDGRHRLPFAAPIFPWRLGLNYRDQSMDGIALACLSDCRVRSTSVQRIVVPRWFAVCALLALRLIHD
jgi:hypothetical protein